MPAELLNYLNEINFLWPMIGHILKKKVNLLIKVCKTTNLEIKLINIINNNTN